MNERAKHRTRRRRCLAFLLGCAALALVSTAAERQAHCAGETQPGQIVRPGPATAPADDLAPLIAQLGSDVWSERMAAQKRLVQLGETARPSLERLEAESADADLRTQARMILLRIATRPTMITLHLKQAAAREALKEIASQAGATLRFDPPGLLETATLPAVTLDCDRQSFWETLLAATEACGLEVRTDSAGWALALPDPSGNGRRAVASGGFLVVGQAFRHTSQRNASGAQVHVDVFPEPRLMFARDSQNMEIDRADGENGESLLPAQLFDAVLRANGYAFTATVRSPGETATHIARCGGVARVAVARPHTVRYPAGRGDADLLAAKDVALDAGDFRCVLLSTARVGEGYEMGLRISLRTTSLELEPLVRSMQAGRLRAFDASGGPVQCKQISINRGRDAAELRVSWGGAPSRVEWDAPAETSEAAVPFTLTDLPLR